MRFSPDGFDGESDFRFDRACDFARRLDGEICLMIAGGDGSPPPARR